MTNHWLRCMHGILIRETLRFFQQRERFLAALVRPLVWLIVFAAGFRTALGLSIIDPYTTYIPYEVYIVPGLAAMVILFNGMQSSLSLVYDREMGSMRMLLTTPLPRWYLIFCRLLAGSFVSILQVYAFLLIALAFGIDLPASGLIAVLPSLLLGGLMLGSLGLVLAAAIKQLENFAGIMNFVIFPMFFLSSALYPLWKMQETSETLYWICQINPFTHVVELIRFSLYWQPAPAHLGWSLLAFVLFAGAALWIYSPARGLRGGSGGPPGR
ncbi:MAG: transport permease protein [Minwuia thermotolerans]|nr:MAG: transport permease protein [Minwuia thermotolerans]